MRIGLDCDGVLYHFHKTALYMLNSMKGYDLKEEEWTYWNQPKDVVSNNDWQWLWSAGVKLGLFRYGHLYKGAIEAVRELATMGDLVVITHRPRSAMQDTIDWLAYLKLPFHEIHLQTDGQSKAEVPCDVYVDDKPENCIDVSPKPSFLMDRPWNRTFEWPEGAFNVVRVSTWKEVVDSVQRLSSQRQR